jgi:hypothetical protein
MTYKILHPINGELNSQCDLASFQYEVVVEIEADSLRDAFYRSQNDFNDEYALAGIRSTSVGDIIQHDRYYYMVNGIGFSEIGRNMLRYKDNLNFKSKENE